MTLYKAYKLMKNILIVIGHPSWEHSVANKGIVKALSGLDNKIVFSNIKTLYPDGNINIEAEQQKLLDADVVVFQFPIQWFGAPSIMHKYMEDVLTYGFAYGPSGSKLKEKHFIASFTTGAPEAAYSRTGIEGYTMDELIPPIVATPVYCGLKWNGYVCSYGMVNAANEACESHALRLIEKIKNL